jgi:hypothetical protein
MTPPVPGLLSDLPPEVLRSILTQSYGEGERMGGQQQLTMPLYRGLADEWLAKRGRDQSLMQQMYDSFYGPNNTRQQNIPIWEGQTPGEGTAEDLYRLPSGQYLPQGYR